MFTWRRPRNSTLISIAIFLVSFGFWLGQPQPENNQSSIPYPDVSWVFVTTTTQAPAPESTLPPETIPVESTLPPVETTLDSVVETTVVTP
jgi:hypothetical protein